jgi:hypothetical protein
VFLEQTEIWLSKDFEGCMHPPQTKKMFLHDLRQDGVLNCQDPTSKIKKHIDHCSSVSLPPLGEYLGSKPIYVFDDKGANTCYDTWKRNHPELNLVPVTGCYDDSSNKILKSCTSASYNTPGHHFMYKVQPTAFNGKPFDRYIPGSTF